MSATSERQPRYLAPQGGDLFAVAGDVYRIVARGDETGNAFALLEATVLSGGGPPPHTHSREDEAFFVLEGAVTFVVEGRAQLAPAGAYVYAPRGVRHAFRNERAEPARMLVHLSPAGFERFFEEVGQKLDHPGQAAPPSMEHIERLIAVAPRYGVEIHTSSGPPERAP